MCGENLVTRMSIKGGLIHGNTAQLYDPPQINSLHHQSSHEMHDPYPINIHNQANTSAGFHEQLSASSLSSRTGFKAHTERESVVCQLPSTPLPERSHVGQLAGSSTEAQLNTGIQKVLQGPTPSKAVPQDLCKILNSIGRIRLVSSSCKVPAGNPFFELLSILPSPRLSLTLKPHPLTPRAKLY
ncbi:hypothetical protein BY996DRAFT_6412090 [Phakopsora pachyrhizi]|nr:hypothetical protein BY996DRAFT_6412090 [Phakopsora pachyrhizi]